MKKQIIKIFPILAFCIFFSACQVKEVSYEFPGYPMEMSRAMFLEHLEKEGLKIESDRERYIMVSGFQIFGIPTVNAQFLFSNEGKILTYVKFEIEKKYLEAILEKMKKQYGEPVDSFRQTDIFYFKKTKFERSSNLIWPEEIKEGKHWVWHEKKPVAEAWTKEEIDKFRSVTLDIFDREGKKREGEEEDWNTFFENTWERVFKLENRDDREDLLLYWTTLYIPEIPKK